MELQQFLKTLHELRILSPWTIRHRSIRATSLTAFPFQSDTLTFVANQKNGSPIWTPTMFLDAANFLNMSSDLAYAIASANDGNGDHWLRNELLHAVGLASRN